MSNAMEHAYTFLVKASSATVRSAADQTSNRLGSVLQGQTVYSDKIVTGVDGLPWAEVATGTRMSNGATLPGVGFIRQDLLELRYSKAPTTGASIPPASTPIGNDSLTLVRRALADLRADIDQRIDDILAVLPR